ncbi:MAG: Re/Si-specific NAD(P)(+) transhydrogenase subunit alpha [Candidatus Latescibacterota bacterium]
MVIGVPTESYPTERRVALTPEVAAALAGKGVEVVLEAGAGQAAGFPDAAYRERGVGLAVRPEVLGRADVLLQVRTPAAVPEAPATDLALLRAGQVLIGLADPLTAGEGLRALTGRGVTLFALELLPRITRAQSMDVLSSMATISGYRAVLLAAAALPRMFPLMMTAAGTVAPARVLVIGAGVAGLQAIATARRLGGVVEAYDLRPEVREQVQSLGARFVDLKLEAPAAAGTGGYAAAQTEEYYRRQREALGRVVAASHVVITTAAVPGRPAPLLIIAEAVRAMAPGSVIVDLAAERGGNCELTQPGRAVEVGGVQVIGPLNLPAEVPYHASQMYAHNVAAFLRHLVRDGAVQYDLEDEITRQTLVLRDGAVVHPEVAARLGEVGTAGEGR